MKTSNFFLLSILMILFVSCEFNELESEIDNFETQRLLKLLKLESEIDNLEEELIKLEYVNSLLDLKNIIYESRIAELLILDLTIDNESITLSFENGINYKISKELVVDYQIDNINWLLNLTLSDSSVISTFIVGDDLSANEVILNPFDISPLTSVINIETPIKGKFTIKVVGKNGPNSDFIIESNHFGTNHVLEVLGLYAGHRNEIKLIFTNINGLVRSTSSIFIDTEELPSGLPEFNIIKNYDSFVQNTLFLINYRPTGIPIMVDPFGEIRWYSLGFSIVKKFALQLFENGNIGYGVGLLGQGSIFEYSMMGEVIKEYSFYPEFEDAHHDVYEMSNGNFLVAVNKVGIETIEDHIIEIDRVSGSIINTWDLREILPMDRYTLWKLGDGSDWFHVNAIIHDESDNSLIVSGQAQGLIKITWDNELKWILAPHEGWSSEYTDYLLSQTGDEFEWNWGQHAPEILPNGNILLFDNGFGREFGAASEEYSRAVEYSILENPSGKGGTVSQIWQYGKERGKEMFSPFMSDVDYLENTSTRLITSGSTCFNVAYIDSLSTPNTANISRDLSAIETRIIEVNEAKEVLFELTLSNTDHAGSSYRAEKLIID